MSADADGAEIEYVVDQCRVMGLRADRVPTASAGDQAGPRADLMARDDGAQYVIEVKRLSEADTHIEELADRGQVNITEHLDHSNAMSAVVRKATEQLTWTPAADGAFRIAWFLAEHANFMWKLRATLYGVQYLGDAMTPSEGRDCYFFKYASFFKHRELTAVVVCVSPGEFGFWPNPFADNASVFRTSSLYRWWEQSGPVLDPYASESEGRAFIADDFSIPPSDAGRKLKHVQAKYERPYLAPGKRVALRSQLVIRREDLE